MPEICRYSSLKNSPMKINKTDEIEILTIFHRHFGLQNPKTCLVPSRLSDGTKTGENSINFPTFFMTQWIRILRLIFWIILQITLDFNECSSHSWSSSLVELRTPEQKWAKKEAQFRHATLTQNASKTIHKFDKSKEIVVGANWNSRSWLGSHGY